jgi:hypothetical protein
MGEGFMDDGKRTSEINYDLSFDEKLIIFATIFFIEVLHY